MYGAASPLAVGTKQTRGLGRPMSESAYRSSGVTPRPSEKPPPPNATM